MPTNRPVKDIMKPCRVKIIDEMEFVTLAIELMADLDISALPVKNKSGQYCGVISRTDIASPRFLKLLREKKDVGRITVHELMNRTPPVYVHEDQTVDEAIALMHRRHIHRVFVADSQMRISGVISTTDILRLLVSEQYIKRPH